MSGQHSTAVLYCAATLDTQDSKEASVRAVWKIQNVKSGAVFLYGSTSTRTQNLATRTQSCTIKFLTGVQMLAPSLFFHKDFELPAHVPIR